MLVLKPIIVCPALALACVVMSLSHVAADPLPYRAYEGKWKGSDGKIYEIRISGGKFKLIRPLGNKMRVYTATSFRLSPTGFRAVSKPRSIHDIPSVIPANIRRQLIRRGAEYRANIKLGTYMPGRSRFTRFRLRRQSNLGLQWDHDKIHVEFITVAVTYSRPPRSRFKRMAYVPDVKVTLTPLQYVCGPDVTAQVVAVVEKMYWEYHFKWTKAQKTKRCSWALNLSSGKFEGAWDIKAFAPSAGSVFGARRWALACAKPRWPCARTVAFAGKCVHYQVLNYVQWGVIYRSCGSRDKGKFLHGLRAKTYGGGDNYHMQHMFARVGASYVRLRKKGVSAQGLLVFLFKQKLRTGPLAQRREWSKQDRRKCKTICARFMSAGERRDMKQREFGFVWGDYGGRHIKRAERSALQELWDFFLGK